MLQSLRIHRILCSTICIGLALAMGAVHAETEEPGKPAAVLAMQDAAYAEGDRHGLDIYVPAEAATGPVPVIIFFYGGGWQFGAKGMLRPLAEVLAAQGYVVVTPDYRVFPEVTYPGFIEDAAAAIRWTRDNIADYGGDPDRIVLSGHSAGAHIAALAALDTSFLDAVEVPQSAIRGVVGMSGPYYHPEPYRDERWCEIFCAAGDLTLTEPMTFVSADAPPMLLLVGEDDTAVPPVPPMAEAAQAVGQDVTYKIYPGLDHGGTFRAILDTTVAPVLADMMDFVERVTE